MDNESELMNKAIPHKGEKRKSHLKKLKEDVVKYTKENSNNSATKNFKADGKIVRKLVQKTISCFLWK